MGFLTIFYHVVFRPIILMLQGLSTPFIFLGQLLLSFVSDDTLESIDYNECKYPKPGYAGSRDELGSDRTGSFSRDSFRTNNLRNRSVSCPLSPAGLEDSYCPLLSDVPGLRHSPTVTMEYHAINIPQATRQREKIDSSGLVFNSKAKALKEMKKYKDARFKSFQTFQEAEEFTRANLTSVADDSVAVKLAGLNEKGSYRMPRTIELLKMRELIESGQYKNFKQLITCNPYFLVSSGDTPPLLHVGARYNAFHIAAKMNKPEIIKIILEVIQDPNFFCKLYGINDDSICDRTERLIDYYLNTPDKGSCETPLHFACKAGYKGVIEVLVNHPLTKINAKNKLNKTPLDLIPESISASSRKQIERFLEERCYVPLYRDEDNLSPPRIGQPCSPVYTCDAQSPPFNQVPSVDSPEGSPLSSRMLSSVVKAYAGPMSPDQANEFRRNWKPSRDKETIDDLRSDQEKGYERIGRQLAQKCKFDWREYWDFLDSYTDISKPDGLEKLETYLQNQFLTFNVHRSLEALYITENITSQKTIESIKSLKNMFTVDSNKNVSGFGQSLNSSDSSTCQQQSKKQEDNCDINICLPVVVVTEKEKEEEEQAKEGQSNKMFVSINKHFKSHKKLSGVKDFNEIMDSLAKEFGTKLVIVGGSADSDGSVTSNAAWMDSVDSKDDHQHSIYTTFSNLSDVFGNVHDKQPLTVSLAKPSASPLLPSTPVKDNATLPPDTVLLNVSSPTGLNIDVPAKAARSPPKSKSVMNIYLNGFEPSKLDLDVYRCVKDVELDSRTYPYIYKWFQKVKSFTADEQHSWRSPVKCFNTTRNQNQNQMSPSSHSHRRGHLSNPSSRRILFGSPSR
ncbi:repeat and LEM domain-containing 2 [Octopus vulgaris]|uniref:Repeat and LEM domain-containing 2 n=2 Tax=Octopus vulgaris TaxID=6645 RepID=A0AA36B1C9_OCTVU|nr:repeat and LEM domain-containing 2 [Octopus vulgaris]